MNVEHVSLDMIAESAQFVGQQLTTRPRVGLVLGSGLNALAEAVEAEVILYYSDIPHFPNLTVAGHVGQLIAGQLEGQAVLVMQGRAHYYEGYSLARVTLPIRVMQMLGIESLVITNAAGGLNPAFQPGDVMLIRDHINVPGMAGLHPLWGPNLAQFGPRFPDMSRAYDPELRRLAREVAIAAKIPFHEGVYVFLGGPSFETPAEIRLLRIVGADAVGMSTAPEVTVARHGGTRVLGISGIANVALSEGVGETTHEEVLEAGRLLVPRLETIVRGVLQKL
ncbi:MAG: purine-nucleoside phosphorylase [Anaerolineae bacterium]|nr:purine-nucleoside phosphorylase [Anaerolineae bacterium]